MTNRENVILSKAKNLATRGKRRYFAMLSVTDLSHFTFHFSAFYLPFPTKNLSMYSKNFSLYISPMGT